MCVGASFDDLTINQFAESINFSCDHNGQRRTAYYGAVPYSYGKYYHGPAEYPDSPPLDNIFAKLQTIDSTVTKENYTCLCTYYENGQSFIPLHHDNELSIVHDSTIYTVSVGATRVLKVSNITVPLQEYQVPLEHGSVYAMSRESQNIWRHGIDREPAVRKPRISLTFRRLTTEPTVDTKQRAPSIAPPTSRPPPDTCTKRILFLGDSLHNKTPSHVFDSAIDGHTCIIKANYQLVDIFGFEPEFKLTDTVIISCGINDLSRYNKTANTLADRVCQRLAHCCESNPRTNFIFNSLTLSKNMDWLDAESMKFNEYMFELSQSVPNLYFFDSHALIKASYSNAKPDSVWEPGRYGNGIHLTLAVRRLVTRELVNAVGMLAGSGGTRFRDCMWLHNVATCRTTRRGRG